MTFMEKLKNRWEKVNSMVCVALDTDESLIPIDSVLEFNKAIIDETSPFVCAYKLNLAFYLNDFVEAPIWREDSLIKTIDYIHQKYSEIPVILDGKFGDIANTSEMYAKLVFEKYQVDATTVNPYFGYDALQPFLDRKDKGIFVLCRTSNRGADEFQDINISIVSLYGLYEKFYQDLAHRIAHYWNRHGNCGLVMGATCPKELGVVRQIVDDMPILVPGVGAQGGDLKGVIKNGLDSTGKGLIINASRSIIYASRGRDFAKIVGKEAKKLRDQINQIEEGV